MLTPYKALSFSFHSKCESTVFNLNYRWINGTLQIELFDKKTNVNIGKEMIRMGYFQPISTKKALSTAKPMKFSSANPRMIPA